MAAPLRPAATKAYLRKKIVWVPTGTYDPLVPSLAILTAISALDVTKMFFTSSAAPAQSQNAAKAPKRIGDGVTYEFGGETSLTLGLMRYSFNQQGAALSDQVKAFEKFVPYSTGFLVMRYGIDRDTDLATTQFVSSYTAEVGEQIEVEEGDAEGAETAIEQMFLASGPRFIKKAIVA